MFYSSIRVIHFHPCSDGKGKLIPLDYGSLIYQNIKEKAIKWWQIEIFIKRNLLLCRKTTIKWKV